MQSRQYRHLSAHHGRDVRPLARPRAPPRVLASCSLAGVLTRAPVHTCAGLLTRASAHTCACARLFAHSLTYGRRGAGYPIPIPNPNPNPNPIPNRNPNHTPNRNRHPNPNPNPNPNPKPKPNMLPPIPPSPPPPTSPSYISLQPPPSPLLPGVRVRVSASPLLLTLPWSPMLTLTLSPSPSEQLLPTTSARLGSSAPVEAVAVVEGQDVRALRGRREEQHLAGELGRARLRTEGGGGEVQKGGKGGRPAAGAV